MNFTYIAILVKIDAKEIMEKIVILFSRFPKIDHDLKIDLHQVLKKMILYHFQDDLNKAKELLCLITINFTSKEVDRMNSYEREIYAKDQEISRITEEKDQEISRLTEEKDREISRITEDYQEMSRLTEEKDQEISRLTEELNKLKNGK